jgi:DNA polymerase III gamma/tau subunit
MGEVPDSLPLTEETRERLRAQANQLGEATVVRLCDLLAVAVDDMRQGGDPRLPLELALVKVTRPAADLERESLAYRLEQLESRGHSHSSPVEAPGPETREEEPRPEQPPAERPSLELEQLQEAWQRTILPAVEQRSIPTASMLREAHPSQLADDRLTVEFPAAASFHRQLAEEPKNATLLAEALYEVTGRKLALDFAVGENGGDHPEEDEEPAGEDEIVQLMKDTFDAREVEDPQ